MSDDEYIPYDCTYIHDTDAAWLLEIEGDEYWIPKSAVIYEKGEDTVEVRVSMAKKKGLY